MLGQVDLDRFVDAHVSTAQDFEENYKVVRARRREAEKLPEIVKVNLEKERAGGVVGFGARGLRSTGGAAVECAFPCIRVARTTISFVVEQQRQGRGEIRKSCRATPFNSAFSTRLRTSDTITHFRDESPRCGMQGLLSAFIMTKKCPST